MVPGLKERMRGFCWEASLSDESLLCGSGRWIPRFSDVLGKGNLKVVLKECGGYRAFSARTCLSLEEPVSCTVGGF